MTRIFKNPSDFFSNLRMIENPVNPVNLVKNPVAASSPSGSVGAQNQTARRVLRCLRHQNRNTVFIFRFLGFVRKQTIY
jgi:hypothetical protein